jgi:hypothetical protein
MSHRTLILKLDGFIRKYYRNRALRGVILTSTIVAVGALLIAFAEYFARFDVLGRTVLFYSFGIMAVSVIVKMVFTPLFKIFRLGHVISYEEASQIVGDFFPEIKDKLLNTLQLQLQINSTNTENTDPLIASVDKRSEELGPVTFTNAIDLGANLQYLRYAFVPAVVILILLVFRPQIISEPTARIIQHRTAFVEEAPFRYVLVSTPLSAPVGANFVFAVRLEGEVVPSTVYAVIGDNRYRMERLREDVFQFTFSSITKDVNVQCVANGWSSPLYTIAALPVPGVVSFTLKATPPAYTGRDIIIQENHGDIIVPEGSEIKWVCRVENSNTFNVRVGDSVLVSENVVSNVFNANWVARSTLQYFFIPSNESLGRVDSLRYSLSVITDKRPIIRVIEIEDEESRMLRYFSGSISDDYGFSRLAFVSRIVGSGDSEYIDFDLPSGKTDDYYFTWDLGPLELQAGDVVEYWIEVWDNDGIHGAKSSKTSKRIFHAPTEEELLEERDEANEEVEASIKDAVEKANELRREMVALKERLREDRDLDWKDERALDELMKKQEELNKTIEEVRKNNEAKNDRLNEFSPQEERIVEKQDELQKLMDELMSDELKELYEKMRELMNEMDPDEIQEHLDQMDVSQDALEKELDRALEQFKQLEWEAKMEETIDALNDLAEKQEELAEESENQSKTDEDLLKEQEELNRDFEEVQKDLKELEKMNEELENPNSMLDSKTEEKSIEDALKESSEQLEKGKEKKASEEQKKAAEEMKDLAKQMSSMQMEAEAEELEEDMDALRALLENIITLSFEEEELMADIRTTDGLDPRYILHGQKQRSLKDDAKMVEDSLYALSLRVRQLAGAVNREVGLVNHHMDKALGGFGDRNTSDITMNQQYVMTSFNNLALLLDEALQQMQNKQECNNPGTGNCNKPGGSGQKPCAKPGDIKKMQEALGEKLEELKKQMGENANKGDSNKENGGLSKQLAELAAQQAALRELAKQKAQELNKDGSGDGGEMQKIADEMEELERDLANKIVDVATLERQKEIITRLLEAEEAERIRGEKEERKSKSGNQNLSPDSPQNIDYLRNRANEIDLLKTIPPDLTPYYRDRVNDYFNSSAPPVP